MKPEYIQLLTPAERMSAIRMGAILKFAEHGVPPDRLDAAVKCAQWYSPANLLKAVLMTAVLGGVPVGVAAHVIGKRIKDRDIKEQELEEKIRFYREATRNLEQGLAGAQPTA